MRATPQPCRSRISSATITPPPPPKTLMFSPPRSRRRSSRYLKYSICPPWYEDTAMPCTSSSSAAVATSSTERLWPRWMTSQPLAWSMRRTMLIEASCPSKSDAAVTKRILFFALYSVCREALRSVMSASVASRPAKGESLLNVYVNVNKVRNGCRRHHRKGDPREQLQGFDVHDGLLKT